MVFQIVRLPSSSRLSHLRVSRLTSYLHRFFKIRNPVVGLLDPVLHTPEYVYSASFTLFSVVCALGCAVSVRPRDRVLYPALLSLAEGSMKWSIAVSVKSLETIQAIINMQYWAPICQRQSDDPCWLHLSHVRIPNPNCPGLREGNMTLTRPRTG